MGIGNWLAGALAIAGLSVSAQTAESPRKGGTLVMTVSPAPVNLVVAFNNQFANAIVSSNVNDGLLAYDDQQNAQPVLATSWAVSPDGLAITLRLRRDVKWHDGAEFTSADVRYSILEVLKKVHPRARVTFSAVRDVETPDAHTAILRLDHPAPVILSALNAVEAPLLPRHLYEGTDPRTNPYNLKPVGTGAFRFKEWKKGQYVELVRNPDYWDTGKPYLDRVLVRDIADPGARAAALETGEVLYIPFAGVPFSDVARLRKQASLAFEQRGYSYNAQTYFLQFNLRRPATGNLKVREAIAHAIDRQGLIDTVWYGYSQVADSPVPKALPRYHTDGVPRYRHDLKRAEALLDEAGYPRGKDGVRLTLELDLSPTSEAFVQAGEYIRQNLRRVGIEIRPRTAEQASYVKKIWTDFNFDIFLNGFSSQFDPEMGLTRLYWSKAASPGVPYITASGYADAEMDRVIEGYQRELDPARRVALFHRFQQIAMRDLPMLPLLDAPFFTLHDKRLQGLDFSPDGARSSFKSAWLSTR